MNDTIKQLIERYKPEDVQDLWPAYGRFKCALRKQFGHMESDAYLEAIYAYIGRWPDSMQPNQSEPH